MLKRLFGGKSGTPGKVQKKVSPLSTKDFRAAAPDPPTEKGLRGTIMDYVHRTSADQPTHIQDFLRRQMFFDMRYRCGAAGRCMVGANLCTYPKCFTWRPCVKGGDVLSEKGQIEESIVKMGGDNLPKHIKQLIEESQLDSNLDEVAGKIGAEIGAQLARAEEERREKGETDPTKVSIDLCGKIIILSVWRAVVLVNARKDEAAVESLLSVLPRIPKEHRGALYGSASGWAALHDMEVRFFRHHLAEFPELVEELPNPNIAKESDTLLDRVVAACNGDSFFLEHCAHEVFGKEISTIIARAQNAQESDDLVEDPMATPFVAQSVDIYKNRIGGEFWSCFFTLAMMPPLSPTKEPPAGPNSPTPRYILDALGRSMLLHHVAGLFGALPSEIRRAEQQSHERMKQAAASTPGYVAPITPEGKEQALMQPDQQQQQPDQAQAAKRPTQLSDEEVKENAVRQKTVVSRMLELVEVVKNAQSAPPPPPKK